MRIRAKSIPLAFDAHCHLFNATDVHVRGFLEGPVGHSAPPLLRHAIAAAAPLVEQMGQSLAISCADEMEDLKSRLTRPRAPSLAPLEAEVRREIDDAIDQHLNRIEEELLRRLPGSEFSRKLDDADEAFRSLRPGIAPASVTPLSKDFDRIREALRRGTDPSLAAESLAPGVSAVDGLDPEGIISFIRYMVSPRHHNLRTFQRAYSERDGAFGLDACFAALVDFDYWLGCAYPSSSLHDQVLLHEQLAVLSGGYVLPLVPYNPWTDIERSGESLALVRWAIEERGFVGVKIYPPMGFRPLGNNLPFSSDLPRPHNPSRLDERLSALYETCIELDVPVLAHTSHSMGRDAAHDELSSPMYWDKVLRRFDGLRVSAGHFGGDHYPDGTGWPGDFADLMGTPGGGGLFADLGYEEQLLDRGSVHAGRIAALLRRTLPDGQSVYSRVMYGSDWLMLAQINNWGAYPARIARFLETIDALDPDTVQRAVYFGNAARCFGLRSGEANRQRLEQFYERWEVGAPPWMGILDQVQERLA